MTVAVWLQPLSLPTSFQSVIRFAPSHIHISRCHPRQIVCQPGIPALLRPMNPPSLAVATIRFALVQPPITP